MHLILEDFGASAGAVQSGDVEIAEIDPFASSRVGLGEGCCWVGKKAGEKIVLNILARQWLSVVALDGESLATEISSPARHSIPVDRNKGLDGAYGGCGSESGGRIGSGGQADITCLDEEYMKAMEKKTWLTDRGHEVV